MPTLIAIVTIMLVAYAARTVASASVSSTVVTANVASATALDASLCDTSVPEAIDLGQIPAGSFAVTGADCTVRFGSSTAGTQLTVSQQDRVGRAAWRSTTGGLDEAFGTSGDTLISPGSGDDRSRATHVTPSGGAVVAGYGVGAGGLDALVARTNPDGTPDITLDADGLAVVDVFTDDYVLGVAVQPDGRIVTAGTNGPTGADFVIMRLLADGSLDPSFGTGGVTRENINFADSATSLLVQADGKIVIAGSTNTDNSATGTDWAVMRLDATGTLDPTFGTGGITQIAVTAASDYGRTITLDRQGRIIVAGGAAGGADIAVARLTADGDLDSTFGTGGIAVIDTGAATENAYGVTTDQLDRVIIGAHAVVGATYDMRIVRLDHAGVVDSGFATGGIATVDVGGGNDFVYEVIADGSGTLLLVGSANIAGTDRVAFARFTADGSLDTTFGSSGTTTIAAGAADSRAYSGAHAGDGAIIVSGRARGALADNELYVARLDATSVPDHDDLVHDGPVGGARFGACLRAAPATTTPVWSVEPDGICDGQTGGLWNPITPHAGLGGSTVASAAASGLLAASVSLRFAMQTAPGQEQGRYVAPIVFEAALP